MKYKLAPLFTCILSLSLFGCDSSKISEVKNAGFSTLTFDGTIGQLFEETQYCESHEWKVVEVDRQELIAGICDVDLKFGKDKVSESATLSVFFEIDKEDVYYVASKIEAKLKSGKDQIKEFNEDGTEAILTKLFADNVKS